MVKFCKILNCFLSEKCASHFLEEPQMKLISCQVQKHVYLLLRMIKIYCLKLQSYSFVLKSKILEALFLDKILTEKRRHVKFLLRIARTSAPLV